MYHEPFASQAFVPFWGVRFHTSDPHSRYEAFSASIAVAYGDVVDELTFQDVAHCVLREWPAVFGIAPDRPDTAVCGDLS